MMERKKIVVLNEAEEHIIQLVYSTLEKKLKNSEIETVKNNVYALYDLAESIALYPDIFGKQVLGGYSRSIETLVENLCIRDIMDLALHIPTKAILGKGFSVAKINFFFMIYYVCRENMDGSITEIVESISEMIYENVFIIMAEEVFLAIISDKEVPLHIRMNAGYMLANIWEYRLGHGVKEFSPILSNIWNSRKKMKPSYGTMFGVSELFQLSSNSGTVWLDFLQRDDLRHDEIDSLQEFLMGLSFEEMELLSREMERQKKTSLCQDDIKMYLGNVKMYPDYEFEDPREVYNSFRHRKKNAIFRHRAEIEGPKKTFEEYLMIYLLARPEAGPVPV